MQREDGSDFCNFHRDFPNLGVAVQKWVARHPSEFDENAFMNEFYSDSKIMAPNLDKLVSDAVDRLGAAEAEEKVEAVAALEPLAPSAPAEDAEAQEDKQDKDPAPTPGGGETGSCECNARQCTARFGHWRIAS